MYVDDLLLMSGSLHNLQLIINICCSEVEKLELVFNPKTSTKGTMDPEGGAI